MVKSDRRGLILTKPNQSRGGRIQPSVFGIAGTGGGTAPSRGGGGSDVSAASWLLGKRGTCQKSLGSWYLRYPLPKTEKSADLAHYFSGMAKFCVKKSSIEREKFNVRSEPDFYWGKPVKLGKCR